MADDKRFVAFTIRGLALDPSNRSPILLLQDTGRRLLLPIWIGPYEATAILSQLEGRVPARPMTHDLFVTVVERLDAEVIGVDICALRDGTFYADLRLRTAEVPELRIDCRPSDGIAITVRTHGEIRVEAAVLDAAQPLEDFLASDRTPAPDSATDDEPSPDEQRRASAALFVADDDAEGRARLAALLEDMEPEDFGEFET